MPSPLLIITIQNIIRTYYRPKNFLIRKTFVKTCQNMLIWKRADIKALSKIILHLTDNTMSLTAVGLYRVKR